MMLRSQNQRRLPLLTWKSIATWFGSTKTPSETIDRIVREAMEQLGMERDDEPEELRTSTGDGAIQFDTAPGLAFTKPLAASINGKSLHSPRWSAILLTMIAQVKAKGFDGDKLVRELAVPAKAEQYEGVKESWNTTPTWESRCRGSRRQIAGRKWSALPRSGMILKYGRVLLAAEPEGAIPPARRVCATVRKARRACAQCTASTVPLRRRNPRRRSTSARRGLR